MQYDQITSHLGVAQNMNARQWATSTNPLEMIHYLENAGCYLEFEPFFMNCFDRIRHEFKSPIITATVYDNLTDVDELSSDAQNAIDMMATRLAELDPNSSDCATLNREIVYSKAVLARQYHDFAEANRFLSGYLIEISDDPVKESSTQAEFFRKHFKFPFEQNGDDWSMPLFKRTDG